MIDLVTDLIVVFYYQFLWEQLTSKISEFQKEFLIICIIAKQYQETQNCSLLVVVALVA